MKFRYVRFVIILAALIINFDKMCAQDVACPSCSMTMTWTGETKTEWGKLFKLYKCPAGHAYWIPWELKKSNSYYDVDSTNQPYRIPKDQPYQNPNNQQYQTPKDNPICPVCGLTTYWTGKTRTEWGKMQKIYECPAGHVSVGPF